MHFQLERERERQRIMEGRERGEKRRTLKLFCPVLSKAVAWAAVDEQRLELGSIARAFGLDPATLKLNGHFIARGVDLVASSVTWRSLLSFFSHRGLSTGATDSDALIVHGKPCNPRTKRVRSSPKVLDGFCGESKWEDVSNSGKPQLEDSSLLKKKKVQEGYSGHEISRCSPARLKRKQWLSYISQLKRLRINEPNTDFGEGKIDISGSILRPRMSSNCNSENMKRMREDETAMATPCKRARWKC